MSSRPRRDRLATLLRAFEVQGTGLVLALEPHRFAWTLGTAPVADLRLPDPTISGLHCSLVRHAKGLLVVDRGSRNGTWIDGVQIERGYLTPGSTLRVGRTSLRAVTYGAPTRDTATPKTRADAAPTRPIRNHAATGVTRLVRGGRS